MSDSDLGKREIEREHLGLFLEAYEAATGEVFEALVDSETPDFVGRDERGKIVGIEITQLRFGPEDRHMRRIFPPGPFDADAWWRLLDLMHQKEQTLSKGRWHHCDRKILVILPLDCSLDAVVGGADTDTPEEDGFDEVWLVDHTQVEAFGGADLFPVVHPELEGEFDVASRDRKPFG
jgi:hypothetical protein